MEFLDEVSYYEQRFLRLAEAIPADKYNWRPAEGVRSIGEVYLHVVGANCGFARMLGTPVPAGIDTKAMMAFSSDKGKVIQALKDSFAHFRSAILAIKDAELEKEIRPTGFFRNKTKSIMGASKGLLEKFGGEVPRSMEEILTLPGVARKTGNVVLGTAYGIASGVVVDTHVIRLSQRLDLTRNDDPKKIEQDLMKVIPENKWIKFSHQLIWHGRRVCAARKPKCAECNLESLCYSKDKAV